MVDSHNGIITFLIPLLGNSDNLAKNHNHNEGYRAIIDIADKALYNYTDDYGTEVKNGFCVSEEHQRYCTSYDEELYPITQTIVGDLVSSIKVLSDKNRELEKNNKEMKDRLEAFEDNLRVIRNALRSKDD